MDSRLSKGQIVSCYSKLARSGKFPDNTPVHQTLLKLVSSELESADPLDILEAGQGSSECILPRLGIE